MNKILVLSSSAHKGGNSDTLADEFIRGAQESGQDVEKVMVDRLIETRKKSVILFLHA